MKMNTLSISLILGIIALADVGMASASPTDIIIGVLILAFLFIIPYLYIRFLENRLISFLGNRLIPFIEFRLRLKRIIDIVHQILEMPVFGNPRSRI